MITVKDLIDKLSELNEDMPVYWGIDSLPCWEAKYNSNIEDFKLMFDTDCNGNSYLYFHDADAVKHYRDLYLNLNFEMYFLSLWQHIKMWYTSKFLWGI